MTPPNEAIEAAARAASHEFHSARTMPDIPWAAIVKAALAALPAHGYKVLPREPTATMMQAPVHVVLDGTNEGAGEALKYGANWAIMWDAYPGTEDGGSVSPERTSTSPSRQDKETVDLDVSMVPGFENYDKPRASASAASNNIAALIPPPHPGLVEALEIIQDVLGEVAHWMPGRMCDLDIALSKLRPDGWVDEAAGSPSGAQKGEPRQQSHTEPSPDKGAAADPTYRERYEADLIKHYPPQRDGEEWRRLALDRCDQVIVQNERIDELERENAAWQDAFNKHDRKLGARCEKLEALADAVGLWMLDSSGSDERFMAVSNAWHALNTDKELTTKPTATNDSEADMGSEGPNTKEVAEAAFVGGDCFVRLDGQLYRTVTDGGAVSLSNAINAAIAQAKAEALREAADGVAKLEWSTSSPANIAEWLRERADGLERGE